jgi:spore germination cell wall hydrolase CwlJ-like protein
MKFVKFISTILLVLFCNTIAADAELPPAPFTSADVRCLSLNLHYEARGEGLAGMVAVGQVTLNRMRSKFYPPTLCGVVKQPYQFSWVKKFPNYHETVVSLRIQNLAVELLLGKYRDRTGGALFFHSTSVDPQWTRRQTAQIGSHIFYR